MLFTWTVVAMMGGLVGVGSVILVDVVMDLVDGFACERWKSGKKLICRVKGRSGPVF